MNIPFLLRPSGKNYLWGGSRLNDEFKKNIDMQPLAETWECSTHPDGPSYVVGGIHDGESLAQVIEENPQYLGSRHKGAGQLPILIKLIDATKDLSVQVHPDDKYAVEHEDGQLGKTEMWYVLDASKESKLVYGFRHDMDKDTLKNVLADGTVMKHVQKVPIKKDDVFFIESGIVHAIGEGALIAEIQENSNITYRMYDYDRVDANGSKRTLHIDKALDVAKLTSSAEPKQPIRVLKYEKGKASELLCRCKYFEVYRMIVNTTTNKADISSCSGELENAVFYRADEIGFRVLLCLDGCGKVECDNTEIEYKKGDCIFVPASSEMMCIRGQAQFLDIRG